MKLDFFTGLFKFIDRPFFWRLAMPIFDLCAGLMESPKWRIFAGFVRERAGADQEASKRYFDAIARIKKSNDLRSFRWLHAAQFFYERSLFRLEAEHQDDPLFYCDSTDVESSDKIKNSRYRFPAGYYKVEFVFSGLQIYGVLPANSAGSVDLFLDDNLIRNINISGHGISRMFSFKCCRSALKLFPIKSVLSIKTAKGLPLVTFSGSQKVILKIPHGLSSSSPLLTGKRKIDKKGSIIPTAEEIDDNRKKYLSMYSDARAFFRNHLGKDLLLAYGTLLGCHRQGGFIPGDDDFDVSFMAESHDPINVKEETVNMVIELVKAGFSVSFNRRGRLFRLHERGKGGTGIHLDVHSFWIQDNLVWAHNDYCSAGMIGDYLPAAITELKGVTVSIPAKPEAFLETHYGPGWKIPDPGFINYYSATDSHVLKNLSRALITPREYENVFTLIEKMRPVNPGMGEFLSLGSRNLYPLPEQDEDLE